MDGLADLPLVAVGGRGVDVAVAGIERGRDRATGLVGRRLEDAQADRRHLDAVVQGDWCYCHVVVLRSVVVVGGSALRVA